MDDWQAFEHMIHGCQQELFTFLLARCAGREQALDALQDVFLRAWVARAKVLPMEHTEQRRYLWTIARNRAIDLHRRRHRSVQGQTRALGEHEAPAAPEPAADERIDHLQQAIDALPPEDRELIYLSAVERWDSNELGARLGMNPGSVRARLSRVRQRLRAQVMQTIKEESNG